MGLKRKRYGGGENGYKNHSIKKNQGYAKV